MLYSNAALRPSRRLSDCSENGPCNRVFLGGGRWHRPPLEVPDNAGGNLRRSRDTARAIAIAHEEKSPMWYRSHKI
jgi:hypothetical protein